MSKNELPEGWTWARLGEVLPIQYGKGLVESARNSDGGVAVFGSSGIVGLHDEALTDGAALIIGRKGSVGRVHYSREPCWPIDTVYFANGTACTDLRFFLHLLTYQKLEQLDRSTAVPGLSRNDYDQILTPLPPLNEQRRVAEKIEELFTKLDAAVASLERVRVNLKRYRAAVLKAAVEGKLTEAWRAEHPDVEPAGDRLKRVLQERLRRWEGGEIARYAKGGRTPPKNWQSRYKEPAGPDTSELPQLPDQWCWATVEQVSQFARYGTSAKTSVDASGIPILRMGNIQEGSLDLEELKYLPRDHAEFPDLLLRAGDLLFNRTNSPELVGKSAVYRGEPDPCSYASYLIALRMTCGCLPDILCYYLNSVRGRAWVASVVSQQVGQANVNGTKLQALRFPLPPLEEQRQIVADVERCLSLVGALQAEVCVGLERAAILRQSILRRAFEGKLVPQDPTDEPADVLLERIRSQHEELAAATNGPRPRTRPVGRVSAGPTQQTLFCVEPGASA